MHSNVLDGVHSEPQILRACHFWRRSSTARCILSAHLSLPMVGMAFFRFIHWISFFKYVLYRPVHVACYAEEDLAWIIIQLACEIAWRFRVRNSLRLLCSMTNTDQKCFNRVRFLLIRPFFTFFTEFIFAEIQKDLHRLIDILELIQQS